MTRLDCLGICELKIKLNSNKFSLVAFFKEGVGMDTQIICYLPALQFGFSSFQKPNFTFASEMVMFSHYFKQCKCLERFFFMAFQDTVRHPAYSKVL